MNLSFVSLLVLFTSFGNVINRKPADTTYYDLLNVSTTAAPQEIRQAFKRLAIKLHPDKNPDPNIQDKFVKITEAYETLKDPDKRRHYDMHGLDNKSNHGYTYTSQSEYNSILYKGLYAGDEYVDSLESNNYFAYLTEGLHFINFYSPFCPPCRKLSDTWKRLAETFKHFVKIASVNCAYLSNFCQGRMRVSSYPTLLFYHGKNNNHYKTYKAEKSYRALEKYIMDIIENEVSIITDTILSSIDKPTIYFLGNNWLDEYTVMRIAFQLQDVARVVSITEDALKKTLTDDEYTTVIMEIDGQRHQISSTNEEQILQFVTNLLRDFPSVTPELLPKIRNKLRSDHNTSPRVTYFKNKENSGKVLSQRLKSQFPDLKFNEMDCENWSQLCASLQVRALPAWGMLKPGGAYELFLGKHHYPHVADFVRSAQHTHNVHTLSVAEFTRIISGDVSVWVLAVVPYKMKWDTLMKPFNEASEVHKNLQFGIMVCQKSTAQHCHQIAGYTPTIVIQNKTQRFTYDEESEYSLKEFIEITMDNSAHLLTEEEYYEVTGKDYKLAHAIAFFPKYCNEVCQNLKYEWKIVSRKVVPLKNVKVFFVDCELEYKTICSEPVASPMLRVYAGISRSYVSRLESLNKAPYILEWMLNSIDDSIHHFTRHDFTLSVYSKSENFGSRGPDLPWLVYFHSPQCPHCYEMFTDFYIAGQMLKNEVKLGKVNCLREDSICNQEQIMRYPSLKLYMKVDYATKPIHFKPTDFRVLVANIKEHLERYGSSQFHKASIGSAHEFKHNEL